MVIAADDPKIIALAAFSAFDGIATLAAGQMRDGASADGVVAAASGLLRFGLTA